MGSAVAVGLVLRDADWHTWTCAEGWPVSGMLVTLVTFLFLSLLVSVCVCVCFHFPLLLF